MNRPPADSGSATWTTSASSNSRRVPAHLSVSLQRQGLPSHTKVPARDRGDRQDTAVVRAGRPEWAPASDGSEDPDDQRRGSNVQTWFDHSNKHPKVAFSQSLQDDPPYFLPHSSSNDSPETHDARHRMLVAQANARLRTGKHSATNGSSADDFRSVIDDLTIENKKLKQKLKKIQRPYSPYLDKDRLFEVKIHGLSARKRRQLEETLRAFTSSLDESSEEENRTARSEKQIGQRVDAGHKPPTPSSTSNSRPVDSAYASMSVSGKTSSANLNETSTSRKTKTQPKETVKDNIQSFRHDMPRGVLPKHSLVLTERQKKRLVVQRLEQLFTGRDRVAGKSLNLPHQQQEVSPFVVRADYAAANRDPPLEGLREANFLTNSMKFGLNPGKLSADLSSDSRSTRDITDSSDDVSTDDASPEQRPTRPLDLDPNRAQIASDNVDYIRHLGQSTPQLLTEDLRDVGADAHGWIYLNLLVNMAQLHIINVTPDFVRQAVQDVSEKFQLSEDGNKIRWRGGSQGTQLHGSSDSSSNSALRRSSHDSDSLEEGGGKRRRIDSARFASIPVHPHGSRRKPAKFGLPNSLQYRPLFNHRKTSSIDSQSSDDSESIAVYESTRDSRFGHESHLPRTSSGRSSSRSKGSKPRDDGPMIFYSGAPFCTDLSGDRDIALPVDDAEQGNQGFSDQPRRASGSGMPPISRTISGSVLPYRPFQDLETCREEGSRSSTPDSLEADTKANILFVEESSSSFGQNLTWQAFQASGLGGTQPADHFAVQVGTKRTYTKNSEAAPLSKFSAPGSRSKKFIHSISKSALDSFNWPGNADDEKAIAPRLASPTAFLPASLSMGARTRIEKLPVKTEIVSVEYINLQPSSLPEPAGYYSTVCSSEDESESECYTSSAGVSHLINHKFNPKRRKSSAGSDSAEVKQVSSDSDCDGDGDRERKEQSFDDDSSDESDVSIDMLAYERGNNPEKFALEEREFEMTIHSPPDAPPKSAAATVAESEFAADTT